MLRTTLRTRTLDSFINKTCLSFEEEDWVVLKLMDQGCLITIFFHFILWYVSSSSSGPDFPLPSFLFCAFFYLPPTDSPKPFSKSNLNLSHSKQTTWHSTSKQAWFCRVPCYNGKTKIKTNKNYSSFQLIQYSRKEKNKQKPNQFLSW